MHLTFFFFLLLSAAAGAADLLSHLYSVCHANERCAELYHTVNGTAIFDTLLRMRIGQQRALEAHYGSAANALSADLRDRMWLYLMLASVPRTCEQHTTADAGVSCVGHGEKLVYSPKQGTVKCLQPEQRDAEDDSEVEEHWHTPLLNSVALWLVCGILILYSTSTISNNMRKLIRAARKKNKR